MDWTRDSTLPYPNVWLRFKSTNIDNKPANYYIQDLPENRFDDAITFMEKYFLPEETMMHSKGIQEDPDSLEILKQCWYEMLNQRLSLVCFMEGSDEIVAVNMLGVINQEYKFPTSEAAPWNELVHAALYIHGQFDTYTNYNTKLYITAAGLAINTKYRKRGVATEMLKARKPLGEALGITLTSTLFTSIGSQKAAKYAGYEDNLKISFDQLAKAGHIFPNVEGEKTIILMSKQF